jgi:hypothetical protein
MGQGFMRFYGKSQFRPSIDDKYFFEELSNGLDREIFEKYDPQKVSADTRPNMYVYMVYNEDFFFAIHLYNNNPFTKKIDKYYYKMELSNLDIDNSEYKFYTYETLKTNPQYLELVNQKLKRNGLFNELEEQNKFNSKK